MKLIIIVLCAASLSGFLSLRYDKALDKQATRPVHSNRVYLDIDRVAGDKVWVRVNNDSDLEIYVSGLPSPSKCEEYPEYYFERVVQRKYTDEARRAIVANNPSLYEKTDEELASQRLLSPRTITIREEREMNWSDAVAVGCGSLGPKQKVSFWVPLAVAQQYERLYVPYFSDGEEMPGHQAPAHRLYLSLASLKPPGTTH